MTNPNVLTWDNQDEDENEEPIGDVEWGGRDGVIFLMDASESMFLQGGASDPSFLTALQCCRMTMLKKIEQSVKDLVGVVLFGTNKKENPLNSEHLTILQKLEQPNIEKIKSLDKMIKSKTFYGFDETHGHSNDYTIHDALWLCQFMFSECEQKLGVKRILLFTSNDKPSAGKQNEQQRAIDRANDFKSLNISLELLPLGPSFDITHFYKDLIESAMGEEYAELVLPSCPQKLEELLLRSNRYSNKKRSQGRILLYLGPDLAIGVGIYSMLRERILPRRVWLESASNLPVQSVTHTFNADTGEKVLPMDVMKSKVLGGEKVIFKPEETKLTKQLLDPGFYLMGFKPQDRIKLQHHYKKPYFIFPDEDQVKGSRKLFAALLKRCSDRKKVILCWGVLRSGTAPHLYALFPQQEINNENCSVQEVPGGFHAYCLPFSENIRSLSFETMQPAEPDQLKLMSEIVSKLTVPYNIHDFLNPRLQTHWAAIEALALGLDNARKVEDNTKPNIEEIEQKIGKISIDFAEVFNLERKPVKTTVKRKGTDTKASTSVKTVKVDPDNEAYFEDLVRQQKVEKLKVDELKTFLMSKDQKVTGKKKAELVKMVYVLFKDY